MKSIQDRPFEALNVVVEPADVPPPVEEIKRIDKSPLHSSKGKSAESAFLPIAVKIGTAYQRWTWRVRNKCRAEISQPCPGRDSKLTLIRLADAIRPAMICGRKKDATASTSQESFMPSATVLSFSENFDTMNFTEGFAFIERTRRQIGMMMQIPHASDTDREELASIHLELNAMEQRLLSHPDCP
jgi:hypothetical protein